MTRTAIIVFVVMLCSAASAADSRVKTEVYNPDKVYDVYTAIGIASLIQFEEGESLMASPSSVLGIGDAKAWNLGVRGNNIVLKPVARLPRTNIVVVTNRRTYTFDLRPATETRKPTYIIRFYYPDSALAIRDAERRLLELTSRVKAEKWKINTEYYWRGDLAAAALVPTAAWDDGRFTRLSYDHAGELPVFYKVLPDGTESLLNYNVDEKDAAIVVLHEVVRKLRVRLSNHVIEIVNKGYSLPELNRAGTGERGTLRLDYGQQIESGRKR